MEFYTPQELKTIVQRSARVLGAEIDEEGAMRIAMRSRGTPRLANRLLKRVRDFAQVRYDGNITREVADYAAPLGCKFALETHMNYLHDYAEAARRLVDMIGRDSFGINLDYGNSVYFNGIAPLEKAIEICGDKLFYTHFKNSMPVPGGRIPTALGEGSINHRAYLKKLREIGFSGLVGIEAPRPGDREYYARQDLAYIRSVMADLT